MTAALALSDAPPSDDLVVAGWRSALGAIDPERIRLPGMLTARKPPRYEAPAWPAVHAAMLEFLDAWGELAVRLGWSAEQLFGVHRLAGAVRVDSTGALVTLFPMRVVALDAASIVLARGDTRQSFRGLTNPDESVPLWLFGRA